MERNKIQLSKNITQKLITEILFLVIYQEQIAVYNIKKVHVLQLKNVL